MELNRALLLVNMGGPANLSEVRSYLRAIFYDPAILPLPRVLRSPLADLITACRYKKVTERYRLLGGKSPLYHWTAALCHNVAEELLSRGDETLVSYAFRYSSPTIEEELTALYNSGISALHILPLFPHYTHTMSGSVLKEAQRVAAKLDITIESTEDWGQDEAVLELWSDYLGRAVADAGSGARVLFVAHGIPLRNVKRGDDYPRRVATTAQQLGLRLNGIEWSLAFQSRVGPVKWTEPYLEDELKRLCKSQDPLVLMPLSFVADCLETIYDLDLVAARQARDAGVKKVIRARVFNDDSRFASVLTDLAVRKKHAVLL